MQGVKNRRSHGGKIIWLATCLFAAAVMPVAASAPEAAGLTDSQLALIRMIFIHRQVHTMSIDLRLFTLPDDRREEGRLWALDDLARVKNEVTALELKEETESLRTIAMAHMLNLQAVADAARKGDHALVSERYSLFYRTSQDFDGTLNAMIPRLFGQGVNARDNHGPDTAADLMPDEASRKACTEAVAVLNAQRYQEAAVLLWPLLERVRGSEAEGYVLTGILACHLRHRSPLNEGYPTYGKMFDLLQDYMERKPYSSYLPAIYFYWQTLQQMTQSGLSNYSDIDYRLHHKVFWNLVEVVMQRINEHPGDTHARGTILELLSIPPIERFPRDYHYGNSVALHLAYLTGMFEKDDSDEGDEAESP